MTITRHSVSATTSDLVPHSDPAVGSSYWHRAPYATWGTANHDPAQWRGAVPGVSAHAATDAAGRVVLEMRATADAANVATLLTYPLPGLLVPGRSYRIAAQVYNPTPTVPVRADVGWTPGGLILAGNGHPTIGAEYTEVWSIVVASEADVSISLRLMRDAGGTAAALRWSNITITEVTQEPTLDLRPTGATIALDESWTPYARATLTCPIPQDDVLERIDPRRPTRVAVSIARASAESHTAGQLPDLLGGTTVGDWSTIFAGPPPWTVADLTARVGEPYENPSRVDLDAERHFDLQLRSRTVDWVAGTMTLELTSDEIALQDFARFEEITDQFTPPATTSLVTLVNWALGLLGWSLSAHALDATIDSSTVVWNLGEELWDFLDAHVRAANRRLWCDEHRQWRLQEPASGTFGPPVRIARPTSLTDTVSRGEGYADSTVVIYRWTDAAGAQQRTYGYADWTDVGGEQPVTLVQRWDNQPGTVAQAYEAAAGLRRRAATRGRTVVVQAVADPTATPGSPLFVTGLAAQVSAAMVSGVTWTYPDDVMSIRTRDAST